MYHSDHIPAPNPEWDLRSNMATDYRTGETACPTEVHAIIRLEEQLAEMAPQIDIGLLRFLGEQDCILLNELQREKPETMQHSLHVYLVIKCLLKALPCTQHLDQEAQDKLVRAALLHDIGKLHIPDCILQQKKLIISKAIHRAIQNGPNPKDNRSVPLKAMLKRLREIRSKLGPNMTRARANVDAKIAEFEQVVEEHPEETFLSTIHLHERAGYNLLMKAIESIIEKAEGGSLSPESAEEVHSLAETAKLIARHHDYPDTNTALAEDPIYNEELTDEDQFLVDLLKTADVVAAITEKRCYRGSKTQAAKLENILKGDAQKGYLNEVIVSELSSHLLSGIEAEGEEIFQAMCTRAYSSVH